MWFLARLQGGNEELPNPGEKPLGIDRSLEDARGGDAVVPQGRDEGHGHPVTAGGLGQQGFAFRAPAVGGCHVGLGPGLIDKDQPLRGKTLLVLPPLPTPIPLANINIF